MKSAKQILANSPRLKRALKAALPLTPSQQKFVDAAAAMRLDQDLVEKAYMARQLVQCTLPHSNPGDIPAWTRQSGNLLLTLQPAWDGKKDASVGYPYGTLPRFAVVLGDDRSGPDAESAFGSRPESGRVYARIGP